MERYNIWRPSVVVILEVIPKRGHCWETKLNCSVDLCMLLLVTGLHNFTLISCVVYIFIFSGCQGKCQCH